MLTANNWRPTRILLATTDIPAEYHANRLHWWTTNSAAWSDHIDADQNRSALLSRLAEKAASLIREVESPVIVDLGCGEGAFLRILSRMMPGSVAHGIDFCPAMLAEAQRRSGGLDLKFVLGDLEEADFTASYRAHLATSVLAMDEMDQLETALRNVARILVPGGAAMLVLMDPINERERNRDELEACFGKTPPPDRPLLLVKTFPRKNMEPAAPYSRIVRPLAQYVGAAAAAGLELLSCEPWAHHVGIGDYSDALSFDVLAFRRP